MDNELSRQQLNSEKQPAPEQYSLRYVKAEENSFTTSIGAACIATKTHKTGEGGIIVALQRLWHPLILDLHIQKIRPEVPGFSLNRTGKGTAQHYSGIGLFVNYQTCTGLRQHGYRLLLETEPETVDPGHRSMLRKRIPLTVKSRMLIQHHSIKDAISITTIRASIGKHEFLHSIESTTYHFPELQQEDL